MTVGTPNLLLETFKTASFLPLTADLLDLLGIAKRCGDFHLDIVIRCCVIESYE
jgi:hypothetical protein